MRDAYKAGSACTAASGRLRQWPYVTEAICTREFTTSSLHTQMDYYLSF